MNKNLDTLINFIKFSLLLALQFMIYRPSAAQSINGADSVYVATPQIVKLKSDAGGKRFDGIGIVNGGGATSVLLKDYPEAQRSQILDLVYKPKFGASVSTLLVEIPGDGNSTQGSMPSHMHTRDDLNYSRGYTWWILQEAKKRNSDLTLDATAWSAPGWIGNGQFWSQDAADYYVKWLQGLRTVYGLELDAIGCRNEKGENYDFAKKLRATLNANGFENVKLHAFDNWPAGKLNFVKDMLTDEQLRNSIDIISAHVFYANDPASKEVQEMAAKMGKPIWNTEDHVYLKGFDCLISLVKNFNRNYIQSGATKIVNWYDIAGVYPIEPYSEDPAMILAYWPWSGHYKVRDALWGYAHYGQFSKVGWQYIDNGCLELAGGGTMVTLKSPGKDYSIILETKGAKASQQIRFQIGEGLSSKALCVWRSNENEQFVRQPDVKVEKGEFTITLDPNSVYSLSTTTGQQKGSFSNIPEAKPFPFPYYETFEQYSEPKQWGYLPRYTADIADAFEVVNRPDKKGKCLRQVVQVPTISWAPDWQPYTILGDNQWQDYEVSADVYLNPGDSAAVLGRINHVGTGYGFIPKGYSLQLSENGLCRLVVIRGKKEKKKIVGDAEQQAIIKLQNDEGVGGEKELGVVLISNIAPNQWHNLKLRFEGSTIIGFVDAKQIIKVTDTLYSHGMAGLKASGSRNILSTPYFDNLLINAINESIPKPTSGTPEQKPIYKR
jgi:galactosylceramidase